MSAVNDMTVAVSSDVAFRELGEGGGVLLHLGSGQYHQVNGTGAEVCRVASEPLLLSTVVQRVRERYPDAGETLEADVSEFVAGMLERDLFVIVDPT